MPANEVRSVRVLHVEQDSFVAAALKAVLESFDFAHFKYVNCDSSERAMKILESDLKIDLIVSDDRPPRVDFAALIEHVRALRHRQNTPVMVIATDLEISPLFAMGADAYFRKPFRMKDTEASIRSLLKIPQEETRPERVPYN